jgi:hypothetical protein
VAWQCTDCTAAVQSLPPGLKGTVETLGNAQDNLLTMQLPLLDITLHSIQFAAILGDLQHKQDVYVREQNWLPTTTCAFSNCNQAHYFLTRTPDLLPDGNWSNHSVGTFFEFFYYSNLTFRLSYLSSPLLCVC